MSKSILSSQLERTGLILREGASQQITDYKSRFSSLQNAYEKFLSQLIRSSWDLKQAQTTALSFFGAESVGFAAVDGTEYSRTLFDLIVFFGGAYACTGTVTFHSDRVPTVQYTEEFLEQGTGVSSCIPVYVNVVPEIDQKFMDTRQPGELSAAASLTDETISNNSIISQWIMAFSELYLAYRLARDPEEKTRIILLDRSLGTMLASLVYDTSRRKLWKTNGALYGLDVDGHPIDMNDLGYARHRIYNGSLGLPSPRGDYLRYAIVRVLEEKGPLNLKQVCEEIGIVQEDRARRVRKYLDRWVSEGLLAESRSAFNIAENYRDAWKRIRKLVEQVANQLFRDAPETNPMMVKKADGNQWLTTQDFAFLSLFALNLLVEECWSRRILLIGLTKDTTARDFKNHLLPVCLNNNVWKFNISQEDLTRIPNTDRMMLQAVSLYNHEKIPVPWSLIEYDSSFLVIVPDLKKRKGYVSGAIRNRISPERLFLKSYIQLSQAEYDPQLRSNVLLIDRLAYPNFDLREDTKGQFLQEYDSAEELVEPILFRDSKLVNETQNLMMVALSGMTSPSIPEVFGHNRPLFVADKVAKWHWQETRRIIDSAGHWIMNNRDLRRFVFYMSTFRERREQIESARRQ